MEMLNELLAKTPLVFWKNGRLETFENWPFQKDSKCSQEKMAAAGFYFIGNEKELDLVECFICSKQLDGWEEDDDPWAEHVKHQPSCALVQLNKPEELSWTIDDLYNLLLDKTKKDLDKKLKLAMSEMKTHMTELTQEIPAVCKGSRKSRKNA